MISRLMSIPFVGSTPAETRVTALNAAIMLRSCSFRWQSTGEERRGCRSLMHEHALPWRRPAGVLRPI